MAVLSTRQRDRLKGEEFAYVDRAGERHRPIHDEEHVRNAVQRFGQTHFESQAAKEKAAQKIVKAAGKHGTELVEDDDVIRAAR